MSQATSRAILITTVLLALIGAAVALAFAGWEPPAITGLLAAVVAVITPMLALVNKTDQVHVMMNQQRTDALIYQRELVDTLRSAGVPVPKDPSLTPPEG